MAAAGLLVATSVAAGPPARDMALHAHLVRSSPAGGDTLSAPPDSLLLVFSEAVEAALSEVRLVGARGDSLAIRVIADSTNPRALVGDLPGLAAGPWLVEWRVVSADGHPAEGSFAFTILAASTPDTVPAAPRRATPEPARPTHAHAGPNAPAGVSAALRGSALFALLVLAGWLLQLVAAGRAAPDRAMGTATLVAIAATLLLGAHFAAWLWHVTPADRSPDLGAALRTGPGKVETLRVALALLAALSLGLARRPRVALVLALATLFVSGAVGHSAGIAPRWSIPIKSIHLVALGVWIGGVAWLAFGALEPDLFRDSAERVSTIALGAVLVVAVTGVAQAAIFLPGWNAVGSAYGRIVLAKTVGLVGLVGFGAWNRKRLLPRLSEGGDSRSLRASVRREIALMLVVTLLAGVLAYVPPPTS